MSTDRRALVLSPERAPRSWSHLVAGVALTTALAVAAVMASQSAPPLAVLLGFLALVSAAYPAAAVAVSRRRPELRLSEEGFATSNPAQIFVPWTAVERFAVIERRGRRIVAFDWSAPAEHAAVAHLARRFIGHDGALTDSYGKDPDELAALLEAWRRDAIRRAAEAPRMS